MGKRIPKGKADRTSAAKNQSAAWTPRKIKFSLVPFGGGWGGRASEKIMFLFFSYPIFTPL